MSANHFTGEAQKCHICKKAVALTCYGVCQPCAPISHICCTSAEDGIKYGIPRTSLDDLKRALRYELTNSRRVSVVKALERAIKKQQKAKEVQS